MAEPSLFLVRHGTTPWVRAGRHTGASDIPLDADGEAQARAVGDRLRGHHFAAVLVSPLVRARRTCELAGFGAVAEVHDGLREWDYGDYEGRTTPEIRETDPGWTIWKGGAPGGESVDEVADRVRRVIADAVEHDGDVLLFGHGHSLRVLAACWIALDPLAGKVLGLDAGSISVLGSEREVRVIRLWNDVGAVPA